MTFVLFALVLLHNVLAAPAYQKRIFIDLHPAGDLLPKLNRLVTSSTTQKDCVTLCHTVAGVYTSFCDSACTIVLHSKTN